MQSPHLDGWEICWIVTGPPRGPPHPTLTIKYSVGLPGIVKASQPRTSQFHPNFTSIQPKHLQIHNCKSLKNSTWKERKKERKEQTQNSGYTLCVVTGWQLKPRKEIISQPGHKEGGSIPHSTSSPVRRAGGFQDTCDPVQKKSVAQLAWPSVTNPLLGYLTLPTNPPSPNTAHLTNPTPVSQSQLTNPPSKV